MDELATENALTSNALTSNALTSNALTSNALTSNALTSNALTSNALTSNALTSNALTSNGLTEGALARQFLSYAYGCAMPAGRSMTLTLNEVSYTFNGSLGLAPDWESKPCKRECQLWVSACLMARTNYYGIPVAISLRNPTNKHLKADQDEQAAYPLYEARFWGNVFSTTPERYGCWADAVGLQDQTLRYCSDPSSPCSITSVAHCEGSPDTSVVHACHDDQCFNQADSEVVGADDHCNGDPSCSGSDHFIAVYLHAVR